MYEVSKLHILLTDTSEGTATFLSLYLEMNDGVPLRSFLDIQDRVFRIWYVKSFLRLWNIWAKKCLGVKWRNHFLADETYVDIIII